MTSGKYKEKKLFGFTLTELMVVISILALVFILGSEFIVRGFKSLTFGSEQDTAVQNARRIIDIITPEIREAKYSERGDYPLDTIEDQTLVLYSDVDSDGETEKIRYFLDDTFFKKGVTEPGASNDYGGSEQISEIAGYLNNQTEPLFYYYDSGNSTTSIINNVRLAKIALKVNVTPSVAPQDFYVETYIQFRNLRDN